MNLFKKVFKALKNIQIINALICATLMIVTSLVLKDSEAQSYIIWGLAIAQVTLTPLLFKKQQTKKPCKN